MAKRTLENCSLIKKMGGYPEQTETECLGFGRSEIDDEPCEICKKCKLYMGYYDGYIQACEDFSNLIIQQRGRVE